MNILKYLEILPGTFSNFASSRKDESVIQKAQWLGFPVLMTVIFNNEDFQLWAEDTESWGALTQPFHHSLDEL